MYCEGCEDGRHYDCGLQTWCECDCDAEDFALDPIELDESLADAEVEKVYEEMKEHCL